MAFEDLDVWKRAARLSTEIYKNTGELKDYGFRDQITRSGLSIPSNIAEGVERASTRDRCRFLDIAKASCAELRTQIYIGMEVGYLEKALAKQWILETRELSAMLVGLVRTLRSNSLPTDH